MVVDQECACGCSKAFRYRAFNHDRAVPRLAQAADFGRVGFSRVAQTVHCCCSCGVKVWQGKTIFVRHDAVRLKSRPRRTPSIMGGLLPRLRALIGG